MTTTLVPGWATHVIDFGNAEYAEYMEQSGRALGGLRIVNLGDGSVALDESAVADLARQPSDADGCIDDGQCWINGYPYEVRDIRHADTLDYAERSSQ